MHFPTGEWTGVVHGRQLIVAPGIEDSNTTMLADEVVVEDTDSATLISDEIVESIVRVACARPGRRECVDGVAPLAHHTDVTPQPWNPVGEE